MNKKVLGLIGILLVAVVVLVIFLARPGEAQQPAAPQADPQRLMIPRWFLTELTVDGQKVALPENHQTLQFEEGGKANGQGGCNDFSTTYQAGKDGKMNFGEITATLMACDQGMQQESAYFAALAKVRQFRFDNYKLVLSSADGKTSLVFSMPPK